MNKNLYLLFFYSFLPVWGMDNSTSLKEKFPQGYLIYGGNNFVIRAPLVHNKLFIIMYGIKDGNILIDLNGEFLPFEDYQNEIKQEFAFGLLQTFKINEVDHNHSRCQIKNGTQGDDSDAEIYHDIDQCSRERFAKKYEWPTKISIPEGMINVLRKL